MAVSFLISQKLDFKVLLVIGNAPGHLSTPAGLHRNVQIVFLPPILLYGASNGFWTQLN